MDIAVGTCGNCGGCVTVPHAWFGTSPPTPKCESCGSVPLEPYGKVIPMKPFSSNDLKTKKGSV